MPVLIRGDSFLKRSIKRKWSTLDGRRNWKVYITFPPDFYLSGSYPRKKLSRNILGTLSLTIRLIEMNLLKPVTLIFLMRTALSEFSMDTTPWVCTTHCENEGKCGDNNFNDYLLPEPCSGDGKLQKYAGCDYRVCEKACSNLTSTTINHTFESNIMNCFQSESDRSFSTQDEAADASIAFGCGHQGYPHGGSFLIGGVGGHCYEIGSSAPKWNTKSKVLEDHFCYGGCENPTGFGHYVDTEEYECAINSGHSSCEEERQASIEISGIKSELHFQDLRLENVYKSVQLNTLEMESMAKKRELLSVNDTLRNEIERKCQLSTGTVNEETRLYVTKVAQNYMGIAAISFGCLSLVMSSMAFTLYYKMRRLSKYVKLDES